MKTYAKIINDEVVEVVKAEDIYKIFHIDTADMFTEVDDNVEVGWIKDGDELNAPELKPISVSDRKRGIKNLAELHVSSFFSAIELVHIATEMGLGNEKASAIYSWIGEHTALTSEYYAQIDNGSFASADFTQLGSPPYSYEEIVL